MVAASAGRFARRRKTRGRRFCIFADHAGQCCPVPGRVRLAGRELAQVNRAHRAGSRPMCWPFSTPKCTSVWNSKQTWVAGFAAGPASNCRPAVCGLSLGGTKTASRLPALVVRSFRFREALPKLLQLILLDQPISARRLMPSARAAWTLLPFSCCSTSRTCRRSTSRAGGNQWPARCCR